MTEFTQLPDRILGLPVGKDFSIEALVKDVWNPETDDLFPPKIFRHWLWFELLRDCEKNRATLKER
ncbi:Uncharacterized protein A9P81_2645 [Leptospira interrogans serovar Copenhageni/Icterohaemorrhagiae]|nr:Uncharacterized protein A9P81_2645 [Leptospira interrogans serovar Copenhageni/Icterohaemorrhagiae]